MEPTRKARANHRAPTLRMLNFKQEQTSAGQNRTQHRLAVILYLLSIFLDERPIRSAF